MVRARISFELWSQQRLEEMRDTIERSVPAGGVGCDWCGSGPEVRNVGMSCEQPGGSTAPSWRKRHIIAHQHLP